MAFKPVRLTDPKGNREDVIATHPVDLTNFQYRDGYIVSEDQSGLDESDATGETASTVAGIRTLDQAKQTQAEIDAEKGDAGDAVASEKASTSSAPAAKSTSKPSSGTGEGKATNAAGNTVQTA